MAFRPRPARATTPPKKRLLPHSCRHSRGASRNALCAKFAFRLTVQLRCTSVPVTSSHDPTATCASSLSYRAYRSAAPLSAALTKANLARLGAPIFVGSYQIRSNMNEREDLSLFDNFFRPTLECAISLPISMKDPVVDLDVVALAITDEFFDDGLEHFLLKQSDLDDVVEEEDVEHCKRLEENESFRDWLLNAFEVGPSDIECDGTSITGSFDGVDVPSDKCTLDSASDIDSLMADTRFQRILCAILRCQQPWPAETSSHRVDTTTVQDVCSRSMHAEFAATTSVIDDDQHEFLTAYSMVLDDIAEKLNSTQKAADEICREYETNLAMLVQSPVPKADVSVDNLSESDIRYRYRETIQQLKTTLGSKRKRGRLPAGSTDALTNWWSSHETWPYPTDTEKTDLCTSTGLNITQLNNWFINRRKRQWSKPVQSHSRKRHWLKTAPLVEFDTE